MRNRLANFFHRRRFSLFLPVHHRRETDKESRADHDDGVGSGGGVDDDDAGDES